MPERSVSREVARRFLLGRQGLWPGRRWRGLAGTETAMRTMGNLQLDPLQVVARIQDLALASRVVDYRIDDWARLTHEQRKFFEWGGWLAVRPMEELPYYRALMRRSVEHEWLVWILRDHAETVEEMRRHLQDRSEVGNRQFAMGDRTRVDSYRGRKDSSVALHYLWRIGEAMVTRRTATFERLYARTEAVAPKRFLRPTADEAAEDFLLLKSVRTAGFSKLNGARGVIEREVTRRELNEWRDRQLGAGTLTEVEIEGLRGRWLMPARELPTIRALERGRLPRTWHPLEATTTDEVTFLSPLDPVIHDRERTRALWGFDYKWGVYDKVEKRKFGYYDLPILWGDRLVARADMKLDRPTSTLQVLGLWFEDDATRDDELFRAALDRGLDRLRALVGATKIDGMDESWR
ncbi:MAG: YcaQ family DNA glycosylase [Chloroflexi bacterium]|nr:YcaQ family DNA glycosylase [Chloroflexota bacterium]